MGVVVPLVNATPKELRDYGDSLAVHPDWEQDAPAWHRAIAQLDWYVEAKLVEQEQDSKHSKYLELLRAKTPAPNLTGAIEPGELNPALKPHQADIAAWAIRGGNRAIFASFGLGKTLIQIQVLDVFRRAKKGPVLIVCPLGVRGEFKRDAKRFFGVDLVYTPTDADVKRALADGHDFCIVNYERVRDGALDPKQFVAVSLDEASVLRSFGSKTYQEFLPLFDGVPNKFVATATPSPNRFKELIHYAGFLGIMDTGQALTRFFKRDSKTAGNLQIHPHKEREFWLWVSSWATFLTKPSDLGYSDEGYDLPPLRIIRHRIPVDHAGAGVDSWGQGRLLRNAAIGLSEAAAERRRTLPDRVAKVKQIIEEQDPDEHWLIWHDLEDERRALEQNIVNCVSVYGSQPIDEREQLIQDFSDGRMQILATKPIIAGSGCNFQRHCARAIFIGVGYKFNDFIQAIHRLYRFQQPREVEIHLIYAESEDQIYDALMAKWAQHEKLVSEMTSIMQEYGLNNAGRDDEMRRSIGVTRQEQRGDGWTAVNNDCVDELSRMADNSVDLVVTSWPFSDHYEYSPSYNDFGHNDGDVGFFKQMEFLSPEVMRVLKPGRMYCVHVKDRLLYGSVTGLGMYSVNPFSDKSVAHLREQGFIYCGRITIVTDVVRENNQTYRLGWTEKCKDATKMGVGSPEYVLIFRKLPTDRTNSYADEPVVKSKAEYTRSRWQFDASPFWRSSGNRFLAEHEVEKMDAKTIKRIWRKFSAENVHDSEEHVEIAEKLEAKGLLPATYMLLDPHSHSPWCWDDVSRMRTLNCDQARARQEQHICPLQFDIVDRIIETYSAPGDLVLDPFGGIMTVPYCAIRKGRKGYGVELSSAYWVDGVGHCRAAEAKVSMPSLFDRIGAEQEDAA